MRKLLSYSLSILLFLVAFLIFSPQPSFALCAQTGNACGNTIGAGRPGNTYVNCCNQTDNCRATDKDIVGNGTRFQCIPTQLTCTCDNNRSTAPGQNGFTCTGGKHAFCSTGNYCHNDPTKSVSNNDIYSGIPLKGIECVANNVVLPPDPGTVPPPDTTGSCIEEGGTCGTDTTFSCCSSGGASSKLSCVNNKCVKTACKQEYETCSGSDITTECCNTNASGVPISCGNQVRADGAGSCITNACAHTLSQLASEGKPHDVGQCKTATAPTCKASVDDSCSADTPCCSGPPNYLYCQPAPHSALGKCQKQDVLSTADLTCKCNSSGDINSYKCYTGTTFYEDRYCTGASPICFDQKTITGADYKEDHGVFCLATAPLAAAPCVAKDSQGRCLAINSPFGLFNTMPGEFVVKAFSIVLAAAGAIAVLLIMRAGYKIMTARGNPEGIQQGREQLIAAIVGLMFLIFSFVFLQVIGVDLLQIPNFSGGDKIQLNGTCDVNNPKCADGLVCKYNGAQGQCQNP